MSLAWLAETVFFATYFVAWVVSELPHSIWVSISAFAALVVAILLVAGNYNTWNRPAA